MLRYVSTSRLFKAVTLDQAVEAVTLCENVAITYSGSTKSVMMPTSSFVPSFTQAVISNCNIKIDRSITEYVGSAYLAHGNHVDPPCFIVFRNCLRTEQTTFLWHALKFNTVVEHMEEPTSAEYQWNSMFSTGLKSDVISAR